MPHKIPRGKEKRPLMNDRKGWKLWRDKRIVSIAFVIGLVVALSGLYSWAQFRSVTETVRSEAKQRIPMEMRPKAPPAASFRVPMLMYHYVEYVKDRGDTIRQTLNVVPHIFDLQVKTLVDDGYTFMTASELADVLDGKSALPAKPILLTFDDGHWDLYTDVLPILKKYHVKATVYVISGFIGGADFMSKDQLKAVIQSGLVEIGAHTVHHVSLAKKLFPVVEYEVLHSKEALQNTYHLSVVSFAYPNGSFDQQAADVVKSAGFRTAVSTIPGIVQSQHNRFFLYRLRPGGRTGQELLHYLSQMEFRSW